MLDAAYGRPNLGNHADPVNELIYILLSTMTTEANYQRSFAALRAQLPSWEQVLAAPIEEVEGAVSGGLAPTKGRLI
jgi:endonuclease III